MQEFKAGTSTQAPPGKSWTVLMNGDAGPRVGVL